MALVQFKATRNVPAGYDPSDESPEKFLTTMICYSKEFYPTIEGPSKEDSDTRVYIL
jgi:hypothetical protein